MNLRTTLLIGVLSLVSKGLASDCPSFFTGADCSIRECTNGGYLDPQNQTCICPSGYLGIHCEAVKTSMPPDNHFKAGGTSFNIMNVNLYTQYWGAQTYDNVKKGLQAHLSAYPNGYDKYYLMQTTGTAYLGFADEPVYTDIIFGGAEIINGASNFKLNDTVDTGIYWCYTVPIFENLIKMIRERNLKNTVITILTQHPPSSDKQYEAREIAIAFGIKVNVLWTKDITFMNCEDSVVRDFKTFVDVTGGLFVELQSEEGDQTTINLVSQVLLTHYKPQYVAIQSFPNCSTPQSVSLAIDPAVNGPYNFVFLGASATTDGPSFNNCRLRQPIRSTDNELTIFQSPDPTCSTFNIKTDSGPCTAIVFTNANSTAGPLDLAIYTTYVEDQTIDASRYAIIENVPFYPAVHVESSSSDPVVLNSISISNNLDGKAAPAKRDKAAYEWISSTTIKCDASQTYSLFLNISVGATTVQRSVRVPCVATPAVPTTTSAAPETDAPTTPAPSTTPKPSTSPAPSTSSGPSTSTEVPSSTVKPTSCPIKKNYATFLFAYATDFDPNTYGLISETIGSVLINQSPLNQTFANKVFDIQTSSEHPINYTSNPMDFSTNCIVDQPNVTLATSEITESNVLDAIREFINVADPRPDERGRLEGSMLVILVKRLPKADDDLTDDEYDKLTNLNVKIFPITTITNLAGAALPRRSGKVFNRIAAQTNGHYVVANDTIGRDVNSDINKIVNNFMQTAYKKNLLFTRNVGVGRDGTNLGVLRVPNSVDGSPVNVTITVSLSAVDVNVPQPPTRLFLGIKPNGNATTKVFIDFLNPQQATGYTNSNYYTTTVELAAGIERELFLIYIAGSDQNDLLIRMWADGGSYREASYINYSESADIVSNIPKIDENIGAALKIQVDNSCADWTNKTATLLITDCNGFVSAKYDSDQIAGITTANFFQFVPFFCSSLPSQSTCISGAESKYDAQFVSDSISFTQSFQCRAGAGPSDNCKLQDANGNNQCSGSSPFLRGPAGSVRDCSNHGDLKFIFNNATSEKSKFQCSCSSEAFNGDSCEKVNCLSPNTDPLATDNAYHTYTVVIGLERGFGSFPLHDGNILFGLGTVTDLKSVWKYQLLTICADGVYEMIYSGSVLADFQKAFKNGEFTARTCNTDASFGVHDLTQIYQQSVRGIGRNVKGIIVYYSEVSMMINVNADEFISASQTYQQQMFVYAVDESKLKSLNNSEAILQATLSTGGFLIQSYITDLPTEHMSENLIPDLLSSTSSIAWYTTNQYGNFPVATDGSSYLLSFGTGQNLQQLNSLDPDFTNCTSYASDYSLTCKLTGPKTVMGNVDEKSFYAAVYLLNDPLAPKAQIISSLSQDSADAVSTSTSDGRTMITFNIPNGYTVIANDGDGGITRNAQRNNCAFDWTAYSVFTTQKYSTGANIAKVTIQNSDKSKTFTRFFPFGTTSGPVCKNGGSPVVSSGSCACPNGFQGPDCSLVNCLENSQSNAWADVCVCNSIDDATCASRYTSLF